MPVIPVLLEYAPYDPIYSITGITPSMTRFEKLFAALSQAYISSGRSLSGLLHLLGYFEEAEQSRFCLLYSLPTHFGPVDIESPRMPSIIILSDLFIHNFEPSLEVKYRLANNVASAVFDLHSRGVVHGNIVSSNIIFLKHESHSRLDPNHVNMRQSYLTSFDLFSDNATDTSDLSLSPNSLYRHPLDPRLTRYTHFTSESKSLDLYSLAMLLLEIGLWTSLQDVFPTMSQVPTNPTDVFKQLAVRCGSLYSKAVQACWHAPEDELSQKARPDVMHQKVFFKVSKALDICCAIDDSSDEDPEENDDPSPIPSTPMKASQSLTPQRRVMIDSKPSLVTTMSTSPSPNMRSSKSETPIYIKSPSTFPEKMGWAEKPVSVKQSSMYICISTQHSGLTSAAPIQKIEKPKPKLRTYPSIKISPEHLDFWQNAMIPHINHVLRGFYKKYPESVEISLESIGETPTTTKPTILVICTSVNKVRSILKKSLVYDKSIFGLKVCRGKVVRSRKHGSRRSMANDAAERKAANGHHQARPLNGASIGAYVGNRNLPPVSFGGLIMVDDKPYGMTVHHMLDDPSDGEEEEEVDSQVPILRSMASHLDMPDLTHSESSVYSSGDDEYMYSLSDYESDFSSENESEVDDEEEEDYDFEDEEHGKEPGDIPGIPQGCGEGYLITQPAIDDIDEDFYPNEETRDEDHLDSFQLGELYASSGIRRRTEDNMVHEIDWALFEFSEDRLPGRNHIQNGHRFCHQRPGKYPLSVAPAFALGDLNVHCMGRTSGLQSGRILPGMVIVKIFGRQTPSASYQVAGKLGVPGDSGAWVVDNEHGRACGHILAWSTKKKVAYICPMDVLVKDIVETLGAQSLRLPGGEELLHPSTLTSSARGKARIPDPSNVEDELASLMKELNLPPTPDQIDEMDQASIENFTASASASSTSKLQPRSPTLADNKNLVPIRVMTHNDEQKTTVMPRAQHMSFVQAARMSWAGQGTEKSASWSADEVDVDADVRGGSGSGDEVVRTEMDDIVREREKPRARVPPPPPPPRRQVGAV
jgi:hypothetical protein